MDSLEFTETPNYNKLRGYLIKQHNKLGKVFNDEYDWNEEILRNLEKYVSITKITTSYTSNQFETSMCDISDEDMERNDPTFSTYGI